MMETRFVAEVRMQVGGCKADVSDAGSAMVRLQATDSRHTIQPCYLVCTRPAAELLLEALQRYLMATDPRRLAKPTA